MNITYHNIVIASIFISTHINIRSETPFNTIRLLKHTSQHFSGVVFSIVSIVSREAKVYDDDDDDDDDCDDDSDGHYYYDDDGDEWVYE
ncbi:hypothetical protein RhiirA1_471596 [Rhizophagus irregularis]|uniref:Uncharacterized protein n=1 Tax=Rhizophagus irregularis TaxID=588596 RepID=A0A2N1MAD7_9GLOM|nr:hypothetical protein RhiirA1_471596 [Rhizophagus irregularis]PKK58586.1 hypothetical protein RhiirC2_796081 [Rhizophagus irregularis]